MSLLKVDNIQDLAGQEKFDIVLGTAVTLTNQTSVDFTGIPSWARRVTVMFSGVSTNGASNPIIQIGGSGGIESSGYMGSSSTLDTAVTSTNYSQGFGIRSANATNILNGSMTIERQTGNTWVARGVFSSSGVAFCVVSSGAKALSGVLDRVRVTTSSGTEQFDAGTVNISWE